MNNGGGRGSRDVFHGAQRVRDAAGFDHWLYPYSDATPVIIISPAPPLIAPGQVWMTSYGAYMARISRKDLPLRMTPADLTQETGLTTVDVDSFFDIYPDAVLVFDPNPPETQNAGPFTAGIAAKNEIAFSEHLPPLPGGETIHKAPHNNRLCNRG
jgi:hypothetical protein